MLSKIKRLMAATSAALLLTLGGMPLVANAAEQAFIDDAACRGADLDLKNKVGDDACSKTVNKTGEDANNYVARIINVASVIVGVVSVIMIIYGGFRYVTSGGESSNISSAKNTILYAIIGLVIVALAQFIVKFVLAKATNVQQT